MGLVGELSTILLERVLPTLLALESPLEREVLETFRQHGARLAQALLLRQGLTPGLPQNQVLFNPIPGSRRLALSSILAASG